MYDEQERSPVLVTRLPFSSICSKNGFIVYQVVHTTYNVWFELRKNTNPNRSTRAKHERPEAHALCTGNVNSPTRRKSVRPFRGFLPLQAIPSGPALQSGLPRDEETAVRFYSRRYPARHVEGLLTTRRGVYEKLVVKMP